MDDKARERLGMTAFIRYKGGIKGDDALIDDRSEGEPLAVKLGAHMIPQGVENAILEMEVGEQRTLDIPSELGYGVYVDKDAQWYPRSLIPRGYDMKLGDILTWTNPANQIRRLVRVTEATQDAVKIDFNHPFAGKELEYWVELVDLK